MALVVSADIVLCDRFLLDRHRGSLCERRSGASVPIGSRALDVLRVLIDKPGTLVSKDAIMNAVWPGIAVEDSNLTVQISALRRALNSGETQGGCIQTVPGRGYRFVGSVTPAEPPPIPAVPDSPTPDYVAPDLATRDGADAESRPGAVVPSPSYPASLPSIRVSRWLSARRRLAIISPSVGIAVLLLTAYLLAGAGWIVREGASPPLSLVVLPFADLSAARDQQYFVDAITADLTANLSRISGAFAISSNTAFTYRDKQVDTKKIGGELGVRYVVGGSIQRAGEQVRVTVQLIDAETDAHLWAERFDSDHGDLLALQNAITARIANSVGAQLVRAEAARPTSNPNALDHLLRGRAGFTHPPSRARYAEMISSFERALVLDPAFIEAQGWLAMALMARVLDSMTDSEDTDMTRAEELIAQVFASSPSDPRAHFAKGQLLRVQRRCAEAIPEYEAALASNRNWASAISNLGRCKIRLGLLDEAITLHEQAIHLDPLGANVAVNYMRIGSARLLQSRAREAITWLEKARAGNPQHPWVRAHLTAAYALDGQTDRAVAELAEARRLGGNRFLPSIAVARANTTIMDGPAIHDLAEATYFAGLRKAGMPEQ